MLNSFQGSAHFKASEDGSIAACYIFAFSWRLPLLFLVLVQSSGTPAPTLRGKREASIAASLVPAGTSVGHAAFLAIMMQASVVFENLEITAPVLATLYSGLVSTYCDNVRLLVYDWRKLC